VARDEFGTTPVDLVIDDASHLYDESRASFETLFPLLHPGGLYIIEDWRWQHDVADRIDQSIELSRLDEQARRAIDERMRAVDEGRAAPEVPLSRLVFELVLARALSGDVVAEISIGPHWVAIRRGAKVLDAGTFRVDDAFRDHFDLLNPRLIAGGGRSR
jgi:hypothetical protein